MKHQMGKILLDSFTQKAQPPPHLTQGLYHFSEFSADGKGRPGSPKEFHSLFIYLPKGHSLDPLLHWNT